MTDTHTTARATAPLGAIRDLVDRLADRLVLLTVWAHPDDESYLGAGLMAEIARRGGRVVSVSATAGEHGTDDLHRWPPPALARRRRSDLDAALQVLGAEPAVMLGYGDGGCDRVPPAAGAARVRSIVDDVRPTLVLGFGRDGVTGHPDHRAVARWTELALANGSTPFLATAAGSVWPDDCVARMHETRAFWPGYPERIEHGAVWRAALDDWQLDRKLEALACHAHQVDPMRELLGPHGLRSLSAVEAYRPANHAALALLDAGRARPAA